MTIFKYDHLRTLFLLILFQISHITYGQLLTANSHFSKYDTLKGGLSPLRTCIDVKKYNIDLEVDLEKKSLVGAVMMRLKAVESFTKIQLDLFSRYKISSVKYQGKSLKFDRDSNHFFVTFPKKIMKDSEIELAIMYQGKPIEAVHAPWDGGFVWNKDSSGDHWVGVACEGLGASSWWPCKDHWSDEPDSGVVMKYTVPEGYTAVGNGKLTKKTTLKGKTTFEWVVTSPINLYDVTINIAKYYHYDSKFYSRVSEGVLDLDFYVLRENKERAKVHFYEVTDMHACFESKFGAYPFYKDGYKLVETPYLGMEHQSCIAYGNKYLKGYLGDLKMTGGYEFDYITIHESGHEWFGNNISASDNADMWIHEAFTTYSESVFVECLHGKDAGVKYINDHRYKVRNLKPIQGPYGVAEEGDGDMYAKGSLMINTLRHHIDNEVVWSTILKEFNSEFRFKTIRYEDVVRFFESKSNMNLKPFFEQYVKKPSLPILNIETLSKNADSTQNVSLKFDNVTPGFNLNVFIKNINTKVLVSEHAQTIILPANYVIDESKGYFVIKTEKVK